MTTVRQADPVRVVEGEAAGTVVPPPPIADGRRRTVAWVVGLAAVLLASVTVAVGLGPVAVPVDIVVGVVRHHLLGPAVDPTWTAAQDTIVWQVRAPRVLLGAAVGSLLAISGATLQALVRNILAEPYLVGVSAGASVGAASVILFGGAVGSAALALPTAAFVGGLLATAAVFALARTGGRITPVRLILAGITLSYGLQAVTSTMIFLSDSRDGARGVLFWLLGSLGASRWSSVPLPAVLLVVGLLLLWRRSGDLDAIALGDDVALSLGVSPVGFRILAFTITAACVAAAVAVAGPIGFVGLVVPHTGRLLVGATHRALLPVVALLGAIVLVWADVLARVVLAPRELPIGVVTALVGAPFLLVLVRRFHGEPR